MRKWDELIVDARTEEGDIDVVKMNELLIAELQRAPQIPFGAQIEAELVAIRRSMMHVASMLMDVVDQLNLSPATREENEGKLAVIFENHKLTALFNIARTLADKGGLVVAQTVPPKDLQ